MNDALRRVHLDTDLGSDTDDLCALAMLLGWDGAELVGVTTSTDPGGLRAGFTEYALSVAGRADIAVRAGAEGSLAGLFAPLAFPEYWPVEIEPRPGPVGGALELLEASIARGATVVAIGPFTNLALLEAARPGLLAETPLVVMGGHVPPPHPGLPDWGVHDDFNVQQDRFAASIVFERCNPIVVPLAPCLQVCLRTGHLDRLRTAGPLGRLIADQGERHAHDHHMRELPLAFPALPEDLLNFHYDPLACAVALDWEGVTAKSVPTDLEIRDQRLWMTQRRGAASLTMITDVEAARFEDAWLEAVVSASAK